MPLIKVNCAAIPETLLESELFGHVRGAFTGATTTKKGKFALADGGTIFLDEIGTMSPTLQSKLLRVLQEREFEPLGSERTEKIDVRVIAATNRDLRQMVADGKFQEDLFYRLQRDPDRHPAAARAARRHSGAGRTLRREARAAHRPAHRRDRRGRARRRCSSTTGRATSASSRTRSSARSCCRRHRSSDRGGSLLGAVRRRRPGLPSLKLQTEHRVGRARDDPAGARERRRREEGRGGADGHQPARAQLLPGKASAQLSEGRPAGLDLSVRPAP